MQKLRLRHRRKVDEKTLLELAVKRSVQHTGRRSLTNQGEDEKEDTLQMSFFFGQMSSHRKNSKNVGILWVWDTIDDHASRSLRIGRKEEQEEKKKILVSE